MTCPGDVPAFRSALTNFHTLRRSDSSATGVAVGGAAHSGMLIDLMHECVAAAVLECATAARAGG
jgi:hypothetical protein